MNLRRPLAICIPLLLYLGASAAAQQGEQPAATILLMTSDVQVAADGSSVQTVHIEVRAGNQAGAQQIGQTSISYDTTAQDIAVVEAHTLKPDGKTFPVDATAVYDQAPPGPAAGMVTGLRAKLIVFPQFTAGDTAVYTVKTTTHHPNFENQFVSGELFPRTQAYNDVRETVTAPKNFPLTVESHEVDASKRDDGANVTYSWHYSAPKPLAEEPVTLSLLERTPRFFVSSFKDYAQLGQAYAALAEPKKVVTPKILALAAEITAGTSDPKTQAQKLYEWVSGHIRYVGIELGTGSFVPHDVDAIVANGYGDCKDHDVLLEALLKAKNIAAESILINSDSSYTLTDVPTFTTLDHVITYIPQFDLYLDSSAGLAPFGVLPLEEYGKPMVVASATSAALGKMPVLQPGIAKVAVKTVSSLDKAGQITGTVTTTASGPYAIILRLLGQGIQGLGPNAAPRALGAMGYQDPSGSFTMDNPAGLAPDFTITAAFKASGWADNLANGSAFFMPPGLRLFGQSGDDVMGPFNPGKMSPGEATICFSAEESEDLSLKASPGYQFYGLPSDTRVQTPNLLFVAHWTLAGDTMSVHRDFTSKIDQALCSGTIRTQSAVALKQIADSYDVTISFAKQGRTGADKTSSTTLGFYNSGFSHNNAGEYELAIVDFDKAIALKPDDYDSLVARGYAYGQLKQYTQGIASLDQALKLKQDDFAPYGMRAWAHENMGQHDLAIADYGSAIALKPDEAEAYEARGVIYLAARQNDLAAADFGKVIALTPEGPDAYNAYFNRARAETPGKLDLAIADLDKAIALKPDAAVAYRARGGMKANQRQFAGAIEDLTIALALQPEDLTALTLRATLYGVTRQYALAVGDCDRLLAPQPDRADWLSARGFAHLQAKEYQLAIADYDKVIALKPDSADAYLYRGNAKEKLGRKKESASDIATAIKLDPSLGK